MSIKNLFNNKGTPKIQKSVSSDDMVSTVESSEFVETKRRQFEEFIPPIDFTTASNFARFGSAELYYEKAFERIYNLYPYDGTLHEKIDFENSSSYLDKYVFDNLYPRTNGYLTFTSGQYIEVLGGPHTASVGMIGKTLDSTFDKSIKYNESKKRTGAFEFRGEDGITVEFWFKADSLSGMKNIFDVSGSHAGQIKLEQVDDDLKLVMASGSATAFEPVYEEIITDTEWNYYAISVISSSSGLLSKAYKNGQLFAHHEQSNHIPHILPTAGGLNMRIGVDWADSANRLVGSLDEFRYWKTERTSEEIFNNWFIALGGGTNKYDSNVALGCYLKFNEGITGIDSIDRNVLDYSGRINNGIISNYASSMRNTGSAITEKLLEAEFLDPIIYSSHPDVISKKAEYKTSGSVADRENGSMFLNYFPFWMQEDDKENGNQLKYLSQILGSYFDTLWHQISYMNKIHDDYYVDNSKEPLSFSKKLLRNTGFVINDLFIDANIIENLRNKDDNEIYEQSLNKVRNTIYHNIYNNLDGIYKSKGTEKSFRNFFRSVGIGQDIVKLKMYADDSTFLLRNNYEFKSHEKRYINFNNKDHYDATLFQTTSSQNTKIYLPGDTNHTGSFTLQAEVILPRKQKNNEPGHHAFPYLTSSIFGYHTGQNYTHPALPDGLQIFVVHSALESTLTPTTQQRIKFVLTGSDINLTTSWYNGQYENNKWSLAVRMKHSTYPSPNITGSSGDDYLLEFYGVEANGNTKLNYFHLSTSSVEQSYFSSDKIFYAGAHKTNFSGSTLQYSDIKLGYVRYWHSYLSNDAIDQHAFDAETFGANEPFEQDLVNVYPFEIPREKTLAFHWSFDNITGADSNGEFTVTDFSSGSSNSAYRSILPMLDDSIEAIASGFTVSSANSVDINFLYSAKKRQPDDLLSSDLTVVKTNETEQFFVDDDVSDNFYSFEKSMWGIISEEMLNLFSTALDLNNLIGQPNQKYHHRYNMMDFLRDRFFDDVENEPDIEKFTVFYKWIDDSISLALKQLMPASSRFSEKINNVIESHVLERNKFVHKIPIVTKFESTEGSIKGISEMKYNWQFGHAPLGNYDEGNSVLWQQERVKKDGLREIIRNSKNNHSLQSSGLVRKEIDGSTRISDTYAVRKFAKTYDVAMASQDTIHGGTNFGRKKNLQLFHESIAPAGALGSVSAVPQNVITVGAGTGSGVVDEPSNKDLNPRKRKFNVNALIGNKVENEYGYNLLGNFVLPMNIMSGTVKTGFNRLVETLYRSGSYITNLHHDIVGNYNETSIQGPFTEQHVGGLQYRHIDLNDGNDTPDNRPEGWGLVLRDHPVNGPDADGALGFIGPDYEAPYPSSTAGKASRYRDEHAKRPINLRNIKTVSGSFKAGNYKNEIEIFSTSPTFQKTWAVEAYNDPNVQILPASISSSLPLTTHYQTLMGIALHSSGNVFGTHVNNRQPDGALQTAATLGVQATGSFNVSGATVNGTFATGSFNVTGSPYSGAFASGSFQVTSSMVQGTNAVGSFSMSGAFSPAVSASFDFRVVGRTILGEEASGSFEVSGAYVAPAFATASFDVSALPVGGKRAYHIFDACYETAVDGYLVGLGRNTDTNSVEVDYDDSITSGNTAVYPVDFQKAAIVSGSSKFFSGSATISSNTAFILNFWLKFDAGATDHNKPKYLYQAYDTSDRAPMFELYFNTGSNNEDRRTLVARHYTENGTKYHEYQSGSIQYKGSDLIDDSGMPWTMITVLKHGTGGELDLFINGTSSVGGFQFPGVGGTATDFSFGTLTTDLHFVMGDYDESSDWATDTYISDFMMWNLSLTTQQARNEFVKDIYNDGIYEPSVPSGSSLGWRYTFGDDASDANTRLIYATYGSGSNLSGSYIDSFSNSLFAVTKSASQYFTDLKTAIESHNSDGTYFNVNYDEYNTTASSALTTYVSGTYELAFVPGEVSSSISIGDTLQFARFYVQSKQESDNSNYDITASVSNGGKSGQERGFIQVHSGSQSSAQQNALDAFDYSKISIDSNNIFFDDHANQIVVTKVATFSTTGSSIEGSSTTSNARFENISYPSDSAIFETQDISISFWHEADGSNTESIVQLATSVNHSALKVFAQNETLSIIISDADRETMTWTKDFSSTDINAVSFNHYTWVYSESTQEATLYANAISQSNIVKTETGTFAGFNDNRFTQMIVGGNSENTTEELRGKLTELSIWSGSLGSSTVSEIYNDGRAKDLYEIIHNDNAVLAHWYRLGEESSLPSVGTNLSLVSTIPDATSHFAPADLTVKTGSVFTVRSGIPSDTISDATFWNNLSSSIEANVADYDVAYVNNTTYATFTVTNETIGSAGNGDPLTENSSLITNLETSTGGGVDESGTNDGSFVTISGKKFESDDDGSSDTSSIFYIQNTGSNTQFWNALSQSIKNNTNFDTINIAGSGDTRIFSITSSIRQASDNGAITAVSGDFSIINDTAGGVNDTGAVDGHYINLRPTALAADTRIFTVDRDNDGVDDTPSKYRYVHSVQSSNADWWNALSASIKAEGYDVSYVADSPTAGTASFTVTSYVAGDAGNSGATNLTSGNTFSMPGATSFAGGLDASGSLAGHTITVSGTVFTLINTGVPTATQVLVTGSSVTSESMFEDLRSKIQAATIYNVTTASSGIPRLFEMTASVTGSGRSPSISTSDSTFTLLNSGTDGANEVGAEAGDSITIASTVFEIVSGTPSGTEISFTGSSEQIRNALSQSIKDNTIFDSITVLDLGTGYHLFSLTASAVGTTHNGLFTTNSSGLRNTFQNLIGATGGINSSGIDDGANITIGSITFHLTESSPGDTSTNKYIITTGSSSEIWASLESKIESSLSYSVATSSASEIAVFNLTGSVTGSNLNVSLSETGDSFTSLVM